MALNNILNEPQREITETVIGLAAVSPLAPLTYWVGDLIWQINPSTPFSLALAGAFVIVVIAVIVASIALVPALYFGACVVHSIGETICNSLSAAGLDPRPRRAAALRAADPKGI